MKHSEEAIEKVLAGLRNSDAPAGMERRIIEAVQNRVLASPSAGWRRLRPIWLRIQIPAAVTRSLVCGVVVAGSFALILAIPAIHWLERAPGQSKKIPAPLPSAPPGPSEVVAVNVSPPQPRSSIHPRVRANARRAGLLSVRDSVALREMRAPSRPAPPLPLTDQEKLLLRFVHAHSAEELAALDPVKWAVRDAKERAEFDKFFGLSTKRGNE